MSTQQKWWEDQSQLMNMGMQSMQDHMYDATRFHHLQQNMTVRIDNYDLQNRHMTAMDVLENFEYARKQCDDYVHPGPTTAELRHPSVRHAYEELQIIMKLAKGSRYE